MQKTDQNLKLLEKKIRELISRVQDSKSCSKPEGKGGDTGRYRDLPLLRGLESSPSLEIEKLLRERREIKEGIRRIMTDIEQYLG